MALPTYEPTTVISALTPSDVDYAARLHAETLPHGFFARLGTPFLRTYYRSFTLSPHAVALVARQAEQPVGVLVGTVRNRAHYEWVLRSCGARLALAGAAALATRPHELTVFLRTRVVRYAKAAWRSRRPTKIVRDPESEPDQRRLCVLTHVAVDPTARGVGVGAALVEAFLAAGRAAGRTEASLVTLADDGASGFYARLGWQPGPDRLDYDGRLIRPWTLAL